MVPPVRASCPGSSLLPRASGDGPALRKRYQRAWGLFPARAGMVPGQKVATFRDQALPRASGDGPAARIASAWPACSSPRERGWSRPTAPRGRRRSLFPARAGMVRRWPACPVFGLSLPRASGDGPSNRAAPSATLHSSPRERDGPSTSLPMIWSPHSSRRERGWSADRHPDGVRSRLFPARAGMVSRGGTAGPPARALPRASGDGPAGCAVRSPTPASSPHERGWSQSDDQRAGCRLLFPARAGMFPSGSPRVPRCCGSSPRERGWQAGSLLSPPSRLPSRTLQVGEPRDVVVPTNP